MSAQKPDDDFPSPSHFEECDSPRKRPRLDNSSRKSWSLMDRRTDQEVLQEMGVSLLEPDELEGLCDVLNSGHSHKTLKRKRDIENVNPNVLVTSPCKSISKSPRGKVCSPSPGPSKLKSPRSAEKARPLQPTEVLETTLLEEYLIDEETPLAQVTSVPQEFSCVDRKHSSYTPLGQEEELIINRRTKCEPSGEDTFNVLSDEMILSVFRWLPKRTLAHCMLVCKRWHRVACDETLWQRLDLGNKTLNKDALGKILDRKPVIVRLASSEIGEWHPTTPPSPCRIQYLDLSMSTIDLTTLDCLLARCTGLKKLSLESVQVETSTCVLIGKCSNLETLNVTMAQGILEDGLTAILTGCPGLQSLNISWCNLSEETLDILVTMLPPKLQRLNVGGSRIMTNEMVIKLVERCPRLLELDLSDCSRVSEPGVRAVQTLTRLEHLALSRCYLLPPRVLTKLSCMVSLQYLEVWGMLAPASLNALRAALPAIHLNQFMFSAIARPTVGTRRTSIWGLRTRD
ncbi:S-phase kinase-associated protein 2 [Ostrinia nubilalis]|uniref:S-phase kinase-associated protein 2 n=1 Tax=Ostrinia nubilalis TaxID=29057 RepID=UPI0030826B2A